LVHLIHAHIRADKYGQIRFDGTPLWVMAI
jgi:hypothetical protein